MHGQWRGMVLALLAALMLSGFTAAPDPASSPAAPAAPTGDLPAAQLSALLLQPADLPGLPQRRVFASAELTTQATPQLALCRQPVPDAPHEIANVLSQSGKAREVKVFQVLAAYADEAGARAAYAHAVTQARSCRSYRAGSTAFRVEDLAEVEVPAGAQAVHYRLTTPGVVGGDVRTLARSGRFLVLVSGFGAPPGGQPLLDYQADVVRRALARLR